MDIKLLLLKYGGYDFQRCYRTLTPITTIAPAEARVILNNIPQFTEDTLLDGINTVIRIESVFRSRLISIFGQEFGEKCFTSSYTKACAESNVKFIRANIHKILAYPYAHLFIEYDPLAEPGRKYYVKWCKKYSGEARLIIINLTLKAKSVGHAICAVLNSDNVIDIFDSNGRVQLWPMPYDEAELDIGRIISEHIYDMCGRTYAFQTIPESRPNINFIVQGRGTCATWAIFMADFYITQGVNNINDAIDKLRRTVPLYVLRTILTNYASWIFKRIQ